MYYKICHYCQRCDIVVLNIYLVQVSDTFPHNTYLFISCINNKYNKDVKGTNNQCRDNKDTLNLI